MTFARLNATVSDLRSSLRSFVCKDALSEITVRPPAGETDEASFLRLVSWSYALVFEAGRVTIPYLLELPTTTLGDSPDPQAGRKLVHALRTWAFHNLGFSRDRDLAVSQYVQRWFIKTCGRFPPKDDADWQSCFLSLCSEIESIITHCQGAMTSVLTAAEDGRAATADLRRRIDRFWPAHEFDKLVGDAAFRLGINVNAQRFREPRLSKWREFLETVPDGDDPKNQMIRLIERDLLDHTENLLPINGRDVMLALGLEPGKAVGSALRRARELFRSGVRDPEQLLALLKSDHPTVV